MKGPFKIKSISHDDRDAIIEFTDKWIGRGYFDSCELTQIIELSKGSSFAAFSLEEPHSLIGVRLSIAPGELMKLGLKDLSVESWPVAAREMAYFKSLFVAESFQGKGLGKSLSLKSIESLKAQGAKAVACHSWLESPGDSSQIYLKKLGFSPVKEHPKYWYDVDYHCTRCGEGKCLCTAVEMVKVL